MCLICKGRISEVKEELNCSGCPLLREIPNITGLKVLQCYGCVLLTEIPVIPGLEELICSGCPLLTEIPNITGLKVLVCSGCPLLTEIPNIIGLEDVYCYNCPFLPQNPKNRISQGLKLQRWIKKNFKFFVFLKWIKSNEGKEFLYHPDNIGGRIEKVKMRKTLQSL